MDTKLIPFNIDLLVISDQIAKTMLPIEELNIFEGSNKNFSPKGLFSTEIFGRVGDERRNSTFSYIDIRVDILHPLIYEVLTTLKGLYGDIMMSKGYAVWNEDLSDFEKAAPTIGSTGYAFFMSHYKDIKHIATDSPKREFGIKLIEKYKDNSTLNKILVMPAGLRDFEFDKSGKPSEDEINTLYRKILSLSNIIDTSSKKYNSSSYDNIRSGLQQSVVELYDYIKSLLEGKHKLVLGKWASRRIQNGTRNVITSLNNDIPNLNSSLAVSTNETVVGLYQYLKATLPISIYNLRTGFLSEIFVGPNSPALLINKKTLKKEAVHIDPEDFDLWMTSEGLEKLINRFGESDLRHEVLEIDNYYLGLIYRTKDSFKLFHDIGDLPANLDKKDVYPLTFSELLYASICERAQDIYGFFTRYPITGYGSIYPTKIYLKTTVPSMELVELDSDWNPGTVKYNHFPVVDAQFMNSMSPSIEHLARLGADKGSDF